MLSLHKRASVLHEMHRPLVCDERDSERAKPAAGNVPFAGSGVARLRRRDGHQQQVVSDVSRRRTVSPWSSHRRRTAGF